MLLIAVIGVFIIVFMLALYLAFRWIAEMQQAAKVPLVSANEFKGKYEAVCAELEKIKQELADHGREKEALMAAAAQAQELLKGNETKKDDEFQMTNQLLLEYKEKLARFGVDYMKIKADMAEANDTLAKKDAECRQLGEEVVRLKELLETLGRQSQEYKKKLEQAGDVEGLPKDTA